MHQWIGIANAKQKKNQRRLWNILLPRNNCHSWLSLLNVQVDVGVGIESRVGLRRKLNLRILLPLGLRRK
jgi:hypothetical protein